MGKNESSQSDDPLYQDYSYSSLSEWFKLDNWEPKVAMCLLCDIDPFKADIDWSDKIDIGGVFVDGPLVRNAQLLSKNRLFYYMQREFSDEQIEKYGIPWKVDPHCLSKEDKHLEHAVRKGLDLDTAEEKLNRIWKIFCAANDGRRILSDGASPQTFVNWALKRRIDIPWRVWAVRNGYVIEQSGDLSPNSKSLVAPDPDKPARSPNLEKQKEKELEVTELRERAKKVAIKLKRDGLPPSRITVKRVCQDLLEENFSTGKPFQMRWQSVEGMRSYLKGQHHPAKHPEFLKARSTRKPFNK